MIYILLYLVLSLVIFFGFAVWNYKQKNRNRTVPAGVAWFAACFWPIFLPIATMIWIANKGEETFDNISENGIKDNGNK
jgi:hypothetical protein